MSGSLFIETQCSSPPGFKSGLFSDHKFDGMKSGVTAFWSLIVSRALLKRDCELMVTLFFPVCLQQIFKKSVSKYTVVGKKNSQRTQWNNVH